MDIVDTRNLFTKRDNYVCLFLNGTPVETPIWKSFWNNSKHRFLTDGALNKVIQRSSEFELPHFVGGDFDSVSSEKLKYAEEHGIELMHLPDPNATDMTKVLEIALERTDSLKEISEVIVLGGLSGRFDHTLSVLNSCLIIQRRTTKRLFVLDDNNLVFLVLPGTTKILVDREEITGITGFIPLCQEVTTVSTSGYKWNLDNQLMSYGELISTSNQVVEAELVLTTTAPLIITFELESSTVERIF